MGELLVLQTIVMVGYGKVCEQLVFWQTRSPMLNPPYLLLSFERVRISAAIEFPKAARNEIRDDVSDDRH